MQANRSFDSGSEALLRSKLHRLGLRFRKHVNVDPAVKCRADITFKNARVCVFVDGCFWHGCPKHFRGPKTNRAWWAEKISDNRARDRRKTAALHRRAWKVIRIWEHDLTADGALRVARNIERIVLQRAGLSYDISQDAQLAAVLCAESSPLGRVHSAPS